MTHLKFTPFDNSTGFVFFFKELLSRLGLKKRNTTDINNGTQSGDNNIDFVAQMKAAKSIMHDDRDVLKKLAE